MILGRLLALPLVPLDVLEHHGQVLHDILLARLVNPKYLSALVEQLAREADVNGGLHGVTSEHPEFDAGLADRGDRLRHPVLQLVFDGRRAQEGQVSFDFCNDVPDLERLVIDGRLRLLELVDPAPVEGLGNAALADEKCPQAVFCVLAEVLQGLLFDFVILSRISQQREENRVSTLPEYLDLPARLLDDDGHPLALGVELNDVQELVLVQLRLLVMIVLDDELVSVIPLHELNTIVLGSVEQGELVGAGTGE